MSTATAEEVAAAVEMTRTQSAAEGGRAGEVRAEGEGCCCGEGEVEGVGGCVATL